MPERQEDTSLLTVDVGGLHSVSALLTRPQKPKACLVLAHGAGAGMTHPFLKSIAEALYERDVATFRYQFPFMEKSSRRPDPPTLAHATVRDAVATAARLLPSVALFAGGKSFGGRMTSQAQALEPLHGVRGLVFLGFPLHPAKKPSVDRAAHLESVGIPMLFVQGDRDALAEMPLLRPVIDRLGKRTTLSVVDQSRPFLSRPCPHRPERGISGRRYRRCGNHLDQSGCSSHIAGAVEGRGNEKR